MHRIYRRADIKNLGITYCDMHLRRLEAAGIFPKRFKLNPAGGKYGAVGWHGAEIDQYVDRLIEHRDMAIAFEAAAQGDGTG